MALADWNGDNNLDAMVSGDEKIGRVLETVKAALAGSGSKTKLPWTRIGETWLRPIGTETDSKMFSHASWAALAGWVNKGCCRARCSDRCVSRSTFRRRRNADGRLDVAYVDTDRD